MLAEEQSRAIPEERRSVISSLTSLLVAAPSHVLGFTIPLLRCLCEMPALRMFTDRPGLVTHDSASNQKVNGCGVVLSVEMHPFTV